MDIERNIKQASADIDAFLTTGEYVEDLPGALVKVHSPVASRRDFIAHFSKWENGKVLFGCAWSWFALGELIVSLVLVRT
jgi:PHS family inorganic phosphate transporter-like MFS transporter